MVNPTTSNNIEPISEAISEARLVNIIVAGAGGRMGKAVIRALLGSDISRAPSLKLAGAFDHDGASCIGQSIEECAGLPAGQNSHSSMKVQSKSLFFNGRFGTETTCLIDFTTPEASLVNAQFCAQNNLAHVIGTTGFAPSQEAELTRFADDIPILKSGNMSTGVTVLSVLVERAAKALANDFDIEITEAHHRAKVDAPSGTALLLGQAAADGRGVDMAEKSVRARDGMTGPRQDGDIGFSVIRGGGIIGDHQVMFASDSETITLSHHALDRGLFADGALRAAAWLAQSEDQTGGESGGQSGVGLRAPGLYSMRDVLGLV